MISPAVVSIDLGSAYTKISFRSALNVKTEVLRGLHGALATPEEFCFPSVVARVERREGVRWLIGTEAAAQRPGDRVTVYRNWKAALFGASTTLTPEEATVVAFHFFSELRSRVLDQLTSRAARFPVRVAVPRIDRADVDKVCRIAAQAGWDVSSCRGTVFEPEANALGLLSRGRNATWSPESRPYRVSDGQSIHMQRMLEPGLSTSFRQMRDNYTFLVSDIGAFTTDFAVVRFDSSLRDDRWNRPEVIQDSIDLGVRQLDSAVQEVLAAPAQEYFEEQSADVWELRKRALYDGRPQQITAAGQRITIGDGFEREAINDELETFGNRVIEARAEFCRRNAIVRVDAEAITGGGSGIEVVRRMVLTAARQNAARVHDLRDEAEPSIAVDEGAGRMSPAEMDRRRSENLMLVRCGSAVGGGSVFWG